MYGLSLCRPRSHKSSSNCKNARHLLASKGLFKSSSSSFFISVSPTTWLWLSRNLKTKILETTLYCHGSGTLSLSLSEIFLMNFLTLCCSNPRSIKRELDEFSSGHKNGKDLENLVSNCITTFKGDTQYRNDPRFLKIWFLYVSGFIQFLEAKT